MTSLKGLNRILRKRLPEIRRWRSVNVYAWDSPKLPWDIKHHHPPKGVFFIVWSRPSGRNVHPVEYKECPLKDLEIITARNRQRYYNKVKIYR